MMNELDFYEIEINGRIYPVKRAKLKKKNGEDSFHIWIWESNIEAAKIIIRRHQIEYINTVTEDLSYLNEDVFSKIKVITINNTLEEIKDLSPLKNLSQLEILQINDKVKGKLNFDWFPNLIEFSGVDISKSLYLNKLKKIQKLVLTYYQKKDLAEFEKLENLEYLELYNSNLETLGGIGRLNKLKSLSFRNCKRLGSFEGLSSQNVNLKEIRINGLHSITSIKFVHELFPEIKISINGNSMENFTKEKVNLQHWKIESNKKQRKAVSKVESILKRLDMELQQSNWQKKLTNAIIEINEIDEDEPLIYTEEREELCRIIQQLAKNHDTMEVDKILDNNREW